MLMLMHVFFCFVTAWCCSRQFWKKYVVVSTLGG